MGDAVVINSCDLCFNRILLAPQQLMHKNSREKRRKERGVFFPKKRVTCGVFSPSGR